MSCTGQDWDTVLLLQNNLILWIFQDLIGRTRAVFWLGIIIPQYLDETFQCNVFKAHKSCGKNRYFSSPRWASDTVTFNPFAWFFPWLWVVPLLIGVWWILEGTLRRSLGFSACVTLSFLVLCSAKSSWLSLPGVSAPFPQLSSGNSLWSAWVSPICTIAWKFSQDFKLGQL